MSTNPYPGLRPFTRKESHLFFGREQQIDQLLDKFTEHRLISITGLSGCGKSSLVRAGLLPELQKGYILKAGADWSLIEMRPGFYPIKNLSAALAKAPLNSDYNNASIFQKLSAEGYIAFVQMLKSDLPPHKNILLLVDQFEELFRDDYQGNFEERFEERKEFVDLLLKSTDERLQDMLIYVVLTIRSDYLGECAVFPGLPERMNACQFFVPRLAQSQLRDAIIEPAKQAGGSIHNLLWLRLLEDMESQVEQLPVLQHCLMRMWRRAQQKRNSEYVELQLSDYEGVGKLQNAISWHANEILTGLPKAQQNIAKRMFRFLVDPTESRDSRHPVQYKDLLVATTKIEGSEGELRDITENAEEAFRDIINQFRDPSCCFLVSPKKDELDDGSEIIDLSHEALISHWDKLKRWKNNEKESVRNYQFLLEVFNHREGGDKGWLEPPELEVILKWKEKHQPNEKWAERYGGNFKKAMKFLDDSQKAQEKKRLQKEEQEKIALQNQIKLESAIKLRQEAEARQKAEAKARQEAEKQKIEAEARQRAEENARLEADKRAEEQRIAARRFRLLTIVLAIMTVIAGGGAWWAIQERNKAEEQKISALAAKGEAQKAQAQAESNSLSLQDMLNAMFGFLSESDNTQQFIEWTKGTLLPERLNPALLVMIDSAERLNEAQKESLKTVLPTMTDADKQQLFDILGTEAAEKIRGQKATLDKNFSNSIVIVDETGNTIPLQDGSYVFRPEQRVNINVTNSAELFKQDVRFEYWPLQGRIESESTYIAPPAPGTPDIVSIKAIDTQTGQIVSEASIKINVIPSDQSR